MDNRSPNYMKPTSNSDKKKEVSQVNTHLPTTNNNQNRLQLKHGLKKTSMPGNRCLGTNSKEIIMKSLSRCTSLRPKNPSMKAPGIPLLVVQDVTRATCSSTMKDSKFPDYVALHPGGTESEGTSAMKVCPYTYCSLNGHFHKSMPPLKRFLSAKRRLIKAHKSIKLRGNRGCKTKLALKSKSKINTGKHLVTQLMSNGEVSSPSWSSRSWEGKQSDFLTGNFDDKFFVEIYANSLPDITYSDGSENAGLVENSTVELPRPIFDMKDFGESSVHTYEEVYSGSRHRGDEQTGDDCLQEAESIANGSSCASNIVDSDDDDDDQQNQSIDFVIEDKEDRNASSVVPGFIHCGKEEEDQNADESNCPMPAGQLAMTSEVCSGSESNEDELDSILCAQEIEETDDASENVVSSSTDLLDVDCVMRRTILNTSLMAEIVDGRIDNISSDAENPLDHSKKCRKNDSAPAQESTVLCETLEIDTIATQNDDIYIVGKQTATKTTGFIDLSPEDTIPLTRSSGTRIPSCLLNDVDDSKFPDDDQSDTQNVEDAETGEDCLLEAPQNGFSCESSTADDKDDPDQQSFFLEYAQAVNASAAIPRGNDGNNGEENQHSGESCSALETNQPSLISKICVESELVSGDSTLELQENVEPPISNGSSLTLVLDNEPDNQNTTLNMTLVGDEVYRDDCNSFNTEIPLRMRDESDNYPPEYSSDLSESLKVDIPASPSDEITIVKEEKSTETTGGVDVKPEDMKSSTSSSNVVPLGSVQDIAEVTCSPTLNKSKFPSYGEPDLGSGSDEAAREDCLRGSKSAISSSFSELSIIDGVNNHQENQVFGFSSDDAEVVNASVVAPPGNDCSKEEESTPLDENNRSIQADQPVKVAKTCVDGETDKNQLVSCDVEMEEDVETRIENGISTAVLGDESTTQRISNATMMGDGVLDKEDSISLDFELPLNHSDKTDSSPADDSGDLSETLDIDISAVQTDNINTGKEEVQTETTRHVDLKPDDIKLSTTSFISGVPLCLSQDTAQECYRSTLEDLNSSDQKCMTDTDAREDRLVEAGCEVNGLSPELCIVADEQDQHIDFSLRNAAESNTSIADPLVQENQPLDENKSSIHADQPVMTVEICLECESDEGNLVSTLAVMKMEGNGESPTNNDSSCVVILDHESDLVTSDFNALDEEPPVIEDSILSNSEVPPDHWEKSDSSPAEDFTDLSVRVEADMISSKTDETNMHSEEFHGKTTDSSDLNPTEMEAKDNEDRISKQGHVKVYVECELDEGELASTVSDMKMEDDGEALINNDSSCIVILDHEPDIPRKTLDMTALDDEFSRREDSIFFNAEIPPDRFEKTDSSPAEDFTNLSVRLEVHIPSPKINETNLFREEIHTEVAGTTDLKPTESKDDEDKISKPDNGSSGGEVSTVPGSTQCQSNDAYDTEESLGYVVEVMAEPDDQVCQYLRSPDKEISGMLEDNVANKEKVACAPNLVSAFPKVEDQMKSSEPGKILETQILNSLMLICKAKDEIATENENLEDKENDTESLQSDTKKEKDCFGGIGGQPAQVECSCSTFDEGTSARKAVDIHISPEKREKDYCSPHDSSDKTSQMQFKVVTKQIAEEHFLAARIKRPTRDDSGSLLCDARKGKGNKPTLLPYDCLDVMDGQPTQFESCSSEADEGNCTTKTVNVHVPLEENETTASNDANASYTSPQGVEKREKVTSVQGSSGKFAKLQFRADTKQDAQKPFLVFRSKHATDIDIESLQSNATNKDANDLPYISSGQPIQVECCSSASEEGNCARKTVNVQVPLQGTESRLSDSHSGSYTSRKCGEKRKQHVSSEADSFDKVAKVKFRVDIKQDKEEAFLASKIKYQNKEENKPMDEKDWSLLFSRCRSNLREITNFEGIDEYEDTSKEENPVTHPNAKLRLTRCYSDSKNTKNSKGKNMVEVMSGSRKINPRKPKFLPIPPWPLRENVVLRHRLVDQRKNPEEFMLDYALRQTVNKLAPTRKKRVAMLVAAFEKVMPLSKCEPYPRHHATSYSHIRTVQSCS